MATIKNFDMFLYLPIEGLYLSLIIHKISIFRSELLCYGRSTVYQYTEIEI